jgi:hypothetical protein
MQMNMGSHRQEPPQFPRRCSRVTLAGSKFWGIDLDAADANTARKGDCVAVENLRNIRE